MNERGAIEARQKERMLMMQEERMRDLMDAQQNDTSFPDQNLCANERQINLGDVATASTTCNDFADQLTELAHDLANRLGGEEGEMKGVHGTPRNANDGAIFRIYSGFEDIEAKLHLISRSLARMKAVLRVDDPRIETPAAPSAPLGPLGLD